MANGQSSFAAALQAGGSTPNVHVRANQSDVNQRVRGFQFDYTGQGNEATGQYVDLGPLGLASALIIPESLRIRFDGSGGFDVGSSYFAKVYADAEPLSVTWSRATSTITVTTAVPHGYVTGQSLNVTVTSDATAVAVGSYSITVTGWNSYTFTGGSSGGTSGTATIGPIAGSIKAITTAAGLTNSGLYTGIAPNSGAHPLVELKKKERLRLVFGTVGTAIPTTRRLYIEGLALSKN